jgi:hypothetical protein
LGPGVNAMSFEIFCYLMLKIDQSIGFKEKRQLFDKICRK